MSGLVAQLRIHGASAGGDADAELMRRVARRDRRAQGVVAERLMARVHNVAGRLLDDASEAEDASQHALIEILQSAASFESAIELETWADRIAARTAMQFARRCRLRSSMIDHPVDPDDCPDLRKVEQSERETPRPLRAYLARLTPKRREAFVLKHALGYTVDEVIGMTGSPRGTVKNRLISARTELRRMINRDMLCVEHETRQNGASGTK